MTIERLSPRQRECLRLIWERQATSKEIAAELGISANTVNGYIAEAVELLGARDRRDAARLVYGGAPRIDSGGEEARVSPSTDDGAGVAPSTRDMSVSPPWRTRHQQRNAMTLAQTLGWIAVIALGSLMALALSASIGAGLPAVWRPVLHGFRRLTL